MAELENKIAIVTGAGKGIGRGIAVSMAKEGATVIIADIDQEGSLATQREIEKTGAASVIIPTDVSRVSDVNHLVHSVLNTYNRVDILVNNVGISTQGGILELDPEKAVKDIETNFLIPGFYLTPPIIKDMKEKKIKGVILFTSSVHGQIIELHPAYTASKAAIEMFVKDVAIELAEYGIRINAVAPGAIAVRDEVKRESVHVPMGYRGTPEDIANTMVFLASDKAAYITGQTITVDGAFSLAHTHYWMKKGIF